MRAMTIAALALLCACAAPPAGAQSGRGADRPEATPSLAGVWAFQTLPYGAGPVAGAMSGAAVFTAEGEGYAVSLVSNEVILRGGGGPSQLVTARQTCRARRSGAQIEITCEMAEPLEGYTPDEFVLQAGAADQLVGVLVSTDGQATFTRLR